MYGSMIRHATQRKKEINNKEQKETENKQSWEDQQRQNWFFEKIKKIEKTQFTSRDQ